MGQTRQCTIQPVTTKSSSGQTAVKQWSSSGQAVVTNSGQTAVKQWSNSRQAAVKRRSSSGQAEVEPPRLHPRRAVGEPAAAPQGPTLLPGQRPPAATPRVPRRHVARHGPVHLPVRVCATRPGRSPQTIQSLLLYGLVASVATRPRRATRPGTPAGACVCVCARVCVHTHTDTDTDTDTGTDTATAR